MQKRVNYREAIVEQLDNVRALVGPHHDLIREMESRNGRLQELFAEYDKFGLGMIVAMDSGESHCIVMPDASHPGMYRFTTFRSIGWTGHQTYGNPEEAIYRAFEAGYRKLVPRDYLDQLAATPEWQKGCARLPFIEKMNAGEISYTQMLEEFAKIESSFTAQAA